MLNVENEVYDHYIELITLLNENFRLKERELQPYPESMLTTILKMVVLVYGAISSLASSYFFADTMLNMAAASLVGTPVGWTLVMLTMLCGLGFYYAMSYTSMINLVMPAFDEHQALKEGLEQFSANYSDDLKGVISIRKQYRTLPFFRSDSANDLRSSDRCQQDSAFNDLNTAH